MDESDVRALLGDVEDPDLGGDTGEPAVLGEGGVGESFRDVTGAVADMVGVVRRRAHVGRNPEPAEH